jgi:DNA polymerase elongation subunit (family B)
MQFFDSKENKMFALGLKDWKHQSDYEFPYEIEYINCKDEVQLLKTYISFFKKLDPLIIYAWNGAGFDFPFIYNRIKNLGMNVNDLSNYGNVSYSEAVQDGKIEFNFNADGHFYTDLMIVYKKFVLDPRPSYSLDTIAEIELKENKVQHTEYASFDDFYTGKYIVPNNPTDEQKSSKIYNAAINSLNEEVKELAHSDFVYYGVKDTYLIKKIDDSKNLTVLMNMIAEKMGVQISDAMGTVKPWSQYIMNKSMLNKRVMPPRSDNSQPSVVGGYVRDPVKGRHKWILSGDVNSMYPLLGMVGFNMSPETFVPKYKLPSDLRDLILSYFNDQDEGARLELDQNIFGAVTELIKKYNYSLGINGAVFSKDKLGMIPEMVQEIYDDRKKSKKIMFDYEKRKVLIGSILNERKQ